MSLNKEDIGKRFRQFRETYVSKGQKLAATKLNISQANISKIESGKVLPGLDDLDTLISQYDANAYWILYGSGKQTRGKGPAEIVSPDNMTDAMEELRSRVAKIESILFEQ